MSTDFVDPLKLSEADDEEETSIQTVATDLMAWEYGADLPEVEVTPEQLDSAEALYMRDIRRYNLLTAQEEVELAETREVGEHAAQLLPALEKDLSDLSKRYARSHPDYAALEAKVRELGGKAREGARAREPREGGTADQDVPLAAQRRAVRPPLGRTDGHGRPV